MFLGIRAKSKKAVTVQVDYIVHIQEIKPWPPSNSLKSLRSIVLQWENGDRSSGFTKPVVPPSGDEKIEFNESFKLHATLVKGAPVKGNSTEVFHKNALELNLYEPRNKTPKGHHIGSATIDLAEHGIIKENLDISVPISCKRSYKNTSQPILFVKIEPFDKNGSNSSSKGSLSKEVSSEEYAEEAEIASFTNDENDLSRSSLDNSTSASEKNFSSPQRGSDEQLHPKNGSEIVNKRSGLSNTEADLHSESVPGNLKVEPALETYSTDVLATSQSGSSSLSSLADLCDHRICEEGDYSPSDSLKKNHAVHSSLSSVTSRSSEEQFMDCNTGSRDFGSQDFSHLVDIEHTSNDILLRTKSPGIDPQTEELSYVTRGKLEANNNEVPFYGKSRKRSEEIASSGGIHHLPEKKVEENKVANEHEKLIDIQNHSVEMKSLNKSPPDDVSSLTITGQQHRNLRSALRKPVISNAFTRRMLDGRGNSAFTSDSPKHPKSVRLSPDTVSNSVSMASKLLIEDVKEIDVPVATSDDGEHFAKNTSMYDQVNSSLISERVKHVSPNKIRVLELRLKMLQEELIETAAIESSLYSIVAEHGSSSHKVHTPARRLSRLYFHASKNWSCERKASAVKSSVSGLILAAKACGNDIPRLTFWLSNTVMLRAIISLSIGDKNLLTSSEPHGNSNGVNVGASGNNSPLKWKSSSREKRFSIIEDFNDWEDPNAVTEALKKIEAWMFSRITESVWWQILTPYMHSRKENDQLNMKLNSDTSGGRSLRLSHQQQRDLSLGIWKKAFKEACGRLCPIRAAGHECGCLPMLSRLVMEQCVARLDVAIFNAILRESEDDIPANPVSDPISDLKVLPIPVGKKSFGAGVLLKNTVGNWSRWLSDLFGIDDFPENEKEQDSDRQDDSTFLKPFYLLNELSDLLMLPKDMLLDSSIRKEICPTFSGPMIKQILDSFVPDEFCPDPIPVMVLEALESEDPLVASELIRNFPLDAAPIVYSPPSVASIISIVGDAETQTLMRRSGSSVIRKCHTSDDELDELASPFTALVDDKLVTDSSKSKEKDPNVMRYQLLREVWSDELMLDI